MSHARTASAHAELLRRMFDAAVASAQPALCVPPHLPAPQEVEGGRLIVVGAGKASAAMAKAVTPGIVPDGTDSADADETGATVARLLAFQRKK